MKNTTEELALELYTDTVFDFIDEMMYDGQWDMLDAMCEFYSLHTGLDKVLAILTITLAGMSKLPSRAALLDRAKKEFGEDIFHGL